MHSTRIIKSKGNINQPTSTLSGGFFVGTTDDGS